MQLSTSLTKNPRLYCSDFYVDVRAVPLLAWLGRPHPRFLRPFVRRQESTNKLWELGLASIGPIQHVDAILLEGEGAAATFDHREWLWDADYGGVLWDLAFHYIALWHAAFEESLEIVSVIAKQGNLQGGKTTGEVYAELELTTPSAVRFSIKVRKYHTGKNDRRFRIQGTRGYAEMVFQDRNYLELRRDRDQATIGLAGSYHAHVVEGFREYLDLGVAGPHGLVPAVAATRLIANAKQSAMESH